VLSVDGPGTVGRCFWLEAEDTGSSTCIYPITVALPENGCDYGRPLTMDDGPRAASPVQRDGWQAASSHAPLSAEQRARWARIGLAEHASVASFGRFALELMALGAPAELIAAAHRAALDEVRHAELAFGLASAHGDQVGPGPLPLGDLRIRADLVGLAVATAREGCVAETLSALQMAVARDQAEGAERVALVEIAADEARHAALAWRTVRWALSVGGEPVRSAVLRVFEEPPETLGEGMERGWNEVILPAARAMLGPLGQIGPVRTEPERWHSRMPVHQP
jgi:hypothetical protein